jgi:hypothetical protein
MRLADFILSNMESILVEWERFASTLLPAAVSMTALALRNEAKEILEAVATDLSTAQTRQAQIDKSLGRAPKVMGAPATAAQTHAILRARSGFDINQLASEYRALRASVLHLWTEACQLGEINLEDVIRFNEAIDQALAESVSELLRHRREVLYRWRREPRGNGLRGGRISGAQSALGAPYAVDPEDGLARCASRLGQIMKRLLPLNLPLMSPSLS